jgi:hypothetical protein
MTSLENRSGANREFLAAIVAQEHSGLGIARHAMDVHRTAERAMNAARPAIGFDVGRGLGFVVEDRIGQVDVHD